MTRPTPLAAPADHGPGGAGLRVGILGPLAVTVAGQPVDVSGRRLRTLLTRLAVDPGRQVPVQHLAEALWDDAPPTDPANAVQSLVVRLRRTLGGTALVSGPGWYRLDLPPQAVDAYRFEELAGQGRRALRAGDPAGAARLLREGLALWRGTALCDAGPAEYAAGRAVRWEELRLATTEDRIEADLLAGAGAQLVAELADLSAAHPLRERLCELRMRALAAAGRPAEALAVFAAHRERLGDELGTEPSPELRHLHLALLRGHLPRVPSRPGAVRGNLRTALTSFVGRAQERERIGGQVLRHRLVTLVGPGGAGKTRLASTVAADVARQLAGGAWLVELAPVTEPDEVPVAVLRALDVRETVRPEAGAGAAAVPRDPLDRLVQALAGTETLLVLDNCEHLVDAAARLADDLLSRCPGLRVLATSREPLGVLGETLSPVGPLPLPTHAADPALALQYPAVQLLRDRAAAVRPGFAVTDDNVAPVVEICLRLDGLPLAIELAAARLRSLPPAQVAAGLGDRFRLLTGGNRTALPRHRTLRAVVAWSWELLTAAERLLAERLAVFPGTFTADSARGVCAGDEVPEGDVVDLLHALVDKSLLQVVDDGAVRFRMLETIREFAAGQLADSGHTQRLRAAHAAHFRTVTEQAEPLLRTAAQLHAMAVLTDEWDNVLAALAHACDVGDADTAVRLAAAAAMQWNMRGQHGEAATWLGRALAVPGAAPPVARVIVHGMYLINGAFAGGRGLDAESVPDLLAQVRALDPLTGHPLLALIEPAIAMLTDDTAAGLAAVERGMAHPDPWARAMLLSLRAQLNRNDGDGQAMFRDLAAAAEALLNLGERWGLASTLTALADAWIKRGDFDGAIQAVQESIRLLAELNAHDQTPYQEIWLASLRARTGQLAAARADLEAFLASRSGSAGALDTAFASFTLGEMARAQGELEQAERHYATAWQAQAQDPMVTVQFRALLHASGAHLAVQRGQVGTARDLIRDGAAAARQAKDMPVMAVVAVAAAAAYRAVGDAPRAARALGAAEAFRGGADLSDLDVERLTAALTAQLGTAQFGRAFAQGRALSRVDALRLVDPGAGG